MPDPALSAALAEAYASAPADVVILHTLEFRHSAFSEPIRVVSDHVALTATLEATAPLNPSEAVEFLAYAFSVQLPDVGSGRMPELLITIDNIDQVIEENIEAAAGSAEKIEVTYRPYLSTDLTAPHMNPPLTLTVTHIEATVFQVRARAGFRNLGNLAFPNQDYTAERFPGLVR